MSIKALLIESRNWSRKHDRLHMPREEVDKYDADRSVFIKNILHYINQNPELARREIAEFLPEDCNTCEQRLQNFLNNGPELKSNADSLFFELNVSIYGALRFKTIDDTELQPGMDLLFGDEGFCKERTLLYPIDWLNHTFSYERREAFSTVFKFIKKQVDQSELERILQNLFFVQAKIWGPAWEAKKSEIMEFVLYEQNSERNYSEPLSPKKLR